MAEAALSFDDSAAYERFMGSWTRAVGPLFLQWLQPARHVRWLDVGCGTGIFTQLVVDRCFPEAVVAVDCAQAQIDHARRQHFSERIDFRLADAQALPFANGSFDVVVSALVINFIPDRPRAVSEMRRVSRTGGVVAGYVWDFAAERSPSWPMRMGMRKFGMDIADIPGARDTSLDALVNLFEQAGVEQTVSEPIEVANSFADFDSFWQAQTPSYAPTTSMILAMQDADRHNLMETVRAELPTCAEGTIRYSARANAIKARAP